MTAPNARRRKILLIGWDGADWRIIHPLLDRGEMPNLERLIKGGVMGNLATLQPMLSPMVWTSVATGKMPDRHGILGFLEVDDHSGEVRPSTSLSRRVKAIWNILSQQGYRTHAVNWFCSHPAEPINGICVSEMFAQQGLKRAGSSGAIPGGTVHPASMRDHFAEFLVSPDEIDAATISLFVPRFREVDQDKDKRLVAIAKTLSRTFSTHAAATWILEHEPWDFLGVYYGAIDQFCHGFLRYHPPRMAQINAAEYELYNDVVYSAYRLQDLLLGRVMELAGEDATIIICSDHGFQVGDLRPGPLARVPAAPAEEHRPVGVFAMKGPGIKEDELVQGASVLDITPTVLTLADLPVGADMDGRPLVEAIQGDAPAIKTIPTWDDVEGESGMHPAGVRVEPREQRALMDQFAALGYVDKADGRDAPEGAALTNLERDWNLARVFMNSRQYAKALPILEEIQDQHPLRFDFGVALAECLARLGLAAQAAKVVDNLSEIYPNQLRSRMLRGLAGLYRGNRAEALEHLAAVAEAKPRSPALYIQLGNIYLLMGCLDDALAGFAEALNIDPDSPLAHLGTAKCHLRLRQHKTAADCALRALGLEFSLSEAHWVLGVALARLGDTDRAVAAFEAALRFQPGRGNAHRILALLYSKKDGGQELAAKHRRDYEIFRSKQADRRGNLFDLRVEATKRANAREQRRAEEASRLTAVAAGRQFSKPQAGATETRSAVTRAFGSSGKEFVIVSGLPRSGTSMMMQMLAAGGAPLMADGERPADESNPEGYYEWEGAKRLLRDPHAIEAAEGKIAKVISLMLNRLPPKHRYKIIFMRRSTDELIASQLRMLERMEVSKPVTDISRLRKMLDDHQRRVIRLLQELKFVEALVIDHVDALSEPEQVAGRVAAFLGPKWIKTPQAMGTVVKPELWRERATGMARAAQ